ncbi:MAG: GH3 auxin-responsive promoter family protein [Syntrophomonadaceae bacterium]|nr:GH3 auxin-responsive promoter family protein [Syntrophomonadaceae bacterium]
MELSLTQIRRHKIPFGQAAYQKIQEDTANPMEVNERLLMQILQDNQDTEYGKKYNFAGIRSVEDYQKNVPVTCYDDYAGYILDMIERNQQNLITSYNVIYYCETSGTLGQPKLLPLTDKSLEVFMTYNVDYLNGFLLEKLGEGWLDGCCMSLIEAKIDTLKNGLQYGPVSSKMVSGARPYLKYLYTAPEEVMFPRPDTNTRYLHARFGLMDRNITGVSSSFCSYFLEIMRYIEKNQELLVNDIEKGSIDESIKMSAEVRTSLMEKIAPMPQRAQELRRIFAEGFATPIIPKLWPRLMYFDGVGTGCFSGYARQLRERYMGNEIKFFMWGINASEGLFSIPFELNCGDGVLVPGSMFYEFLPVEAGDDFSQIVTMDKLETGKVYEIILTNLSGFYRYRMRDAVRVKGKFHNTPTIQFEYRIDQTLDILDDHTTEIALSTAAENTAKELGFDLVDFSVYPDRDSSPTRYIYVMEIGQRPEKVTYEEIRNCLDRQLAIVNPYLGEVIEKGICGATALKIAQDETYLLYRDLMFMKGRSTAQLKPVRIIQNEFQRRFFFGLIEEAVEKRTAKA